MSFTLTPEQEMVQKMVREFSENEIKPLAAEVDEKAEYPAELLKKLSELGLFGMLAPAKYDGAETDYVSFVVSIEELAKACASTAVKVSIHNVLACYPISKYGTEDQKEKYLRDLAVGKKIGGMGATETVSGSNFNEILTTVKKENDAFILNGRKDYVVNCLDAEVFIVSGKDSDGKISVFIVDRDMEGVIIGKKKGLMGLRAAGTASLTLDSVKVPKENLLGEEGKGEKILTDSWEKMKLAISAVAVGIAQAAFEESVNYANQRVQFGQVIGKFQAIQEKIADMAIKIEAARCLLYNLAKEIEKRRGVEKELNILKVFSSTIAVETAKASIRVYGGYGYIKDNPLERFTRDAWGTRIIATPITKLKALIAENILGYRK